MDHQRVLSQMLVVPAHTRAFTAFQFNRILNLNSDHFESCMQPDASQDLVPTSRGEESTEGTNVFVVVAIALWLPP